MRLSDPLCPECGEPACGTVERLSGYAEFLGVPGTDDEIEYSGWTEIWWDEQRTVQQNENAPPGPDNLPLVCCANGHVWATGIA